MQLFRISRSMFSRTKIIKKRVTYMYQPDRYLDYQELSQLLQSFATKYPRYCELASIGTTPEARDIWCCTLTDSESGSASDKPAYWVSGNIHASELTGCQSALHTLYRILDGVERDDNRFVNLLREMAIYVVPRISPDGVEATLAGGFYRSSNQVYPDAKYPAYYIQDIDGDRVARKLLKVDAGGIWKKSRKDPRILLQRLPHENDPAETYYNIYPEGKVEGDYQHRYWTRNASGHDYNRNFPSHWRPEHEQKGAGRYPLSNPETRAIAEFIAAHDNIIGAQDFHTFSAVILRPGINLSDHDMPVDDLHIFKALGKVGTDITGYPCVSICDDFKLNRNENISGGFIDWLYSDRGVYPFTNEIWNLFKASGIEVDIKDHIEFIMSALSESDQQKLLNWCDQHCEPGYFKDWEPYHHPDLGEVEIGGWDLLQTLWNPPLALLHDEVEKNSEFVIAMMEACPRVVINRAETQKLADHLTRVTIELQNTGYLPTRGNSTARTSQSARFPSLRVTLPESACQIRSGEPFQKIEHLEGRSRIEPVTSQLWDINPAQPTDRAVFEWVIEGSGEVLFEFDYVKGGIHRKIIKI